MWKALLHAREHSDLVILDQGHARAVNAQLETLLRRHPRPPVVTVPSIDADDPMQVGVIDTARRVLGIG